MIFEHLKILPVLMQNSQQLIKRLQKEKYLIFSMLRATIWSIINWYSLSWNEWKNWTNPEKHEKMQNLRIKEFNSVNSKNVFTNDKLSSLL